MGKVRYRKFENYHPEDLDKEDVNLNFKQIKEEFDAENMFNSAIKKLEEKRSKDSDVIYKVSVLPSKKDYDDDKFRPINQTFEEYKRAKYSEGVEGRIEEKYKQEFKDALGYTCKGCGKNYEKNKHKIELHHLVPYSDLKVGDERILTIKDFAVLCVKCHKAIHQLKDVSDIKQLRKWNKKSPNYNVILEKDENGYGY